MTHGDHAQAAHAHDGDDLVVVAGVHIHAAAQQGCGLHDLGDVAVGLLDAPDVGVVGQRDTTLSSATPSTRAAAIIIEVRMSPPYSGWRAMPSMAPCPILPMPIPAPTVARPAPMAAPK